MANFVVAASVTRTSKKGDGLMLKSGYEFDLWIRGLPTCFRVLYVGLWHRDCKRKCAVVLLSEVGTHGAPILMPFARVPKGVHLTKTKTSRPRIPPKLTPYPRPADKKVGWEHIATADVEQEDSGEGDVAEGALGEDGYEGDDPDSDTAIMLSAEEDDDTGKDALGLELEELKAKLALMEKERTQELEAERAKSAQVMAAEKAKAAELQAKNDQLTFEAQVNKKMAEREKEWAEKLAAAEREKAQFKEKAAAALEKEKAIKEMTNQLIKAKEREVASVTVHAMHISFAHIHNPTCFVYVCETYVHCVSAGSRQVEVSNAGNGGEGAKHCQPGVVSPHVYRP